jgi:hypothetical protein
VEFHFDHSEIEKLDARFRGGGIVTLSELRRRYSKRYAKIKKPSQLENETEYYFLRNVLNDASAKTAEECQLLKKMVSRYDAA